MAEPALPAPERASALREQTGAVIAGATIISLPLGSIYAFSVFLVPLETLLGASRSELASVFGISVIFFTLGMNLVPRLFGLVGLPALMLLSGMLSAAGIGISAVASTFWELAVGFGAVFAFGGGLAYVAAQQSVNAAPLKRPGLVNGYLVSLFPLGAMLAVPVCGWAIDAFGVRTTLAGLAIVCGLAALMATELILRSGVRLGRASAGEPVADGEGRRLRIVFWKLFVVFLTAAASGLLVLSQAVGILVAYGGSKPAALAATTGITAAIAAARIAGGFLVDRLAVPTVAALAHCLAVAGAILLTLAPGPMMAIPTLGLIGIGYGLISGVTAAAVALYWPKALFGRTASRVYIAWCLAALTLPVAAAWLYDQTGGYSLAIILSGGANLIGVAVGLSLPRARTMAVAPRAGTAAAT